MLATKNTKNHKNEIAPFLCLFVLFVAILPVDQVLLYVEFDRAEVDQQASCRCRNGASLGPAYLSTFTTVNAAKS